MVRLSISINSKLYIWLILWTNPKTNNNSSPSNWAPCDSKPSTASTKVRLWSGWSNSDWAILWGMFPESNNSSFWRRSPRKMRRCTTICSEMSRLFVTCWTGVRNSTTWHLWSSSMQKSRGCGPTERLCINCSKDLKYCAVTMRIWRRWCTFRELACRSAWSNPAARNLQPLLSDLSSTGRESRLLRCMSMFLNLCSRRRIWNLTIWSW